MIKIEYRGVKQEYNDYFYRLIGILFFLFDVKNDLSFYFFDSGSRLRLSLFSNQFVIVKLSGYNLIWIGFKGVSAFLELSKGL